MNERDDLERLLESMGSTPAPGPDPDFVRILEVHLSSAGAAANVSPIVRRTRRVGVVGIAAASLAFAGVAAAAGVAITRPFDDEPAVVTTTVPATPAPSTTEPVTTTEPATTVAVTTPPTTPAPTEPPTTLPVTVPPTEPPRTVPPTAPPRTTVAATEPPATTTTEVRTPATIELACVVVDVTKVRCTWGAGPVGTARFQVLRGDPAGGPGRAYEVGLDAGNSWLDPLAAPGTSATYVVWATDASGKGIAHSALVRVDCC